MCARLQTGSERFLCLVLSILSVVDTVSLHQVANDQGCGNLMSTVLKASSMCDPALYVWIVPVQSFKPGLLLHATLLPSTFRMLADKRLYKCWCIDPGLSCLTHHCAITVVSHSQVSETGSEMLSCI